MLDSHRAYLDGEENELAQGQYRNDCDGFHDFASLVRLLAAFL
jgi:hypothetical protein